MEEQGTFAGQFSSRRLLPTRPLSLMPASDPDASFTLDDLVGHEKEVSLSPLPDTNAGALNGHLSANGSVVDSYAARLDELLLEDEGSDPRHPGISSPNSHDRDEDHEEDEEDDDDDAGFVYTGADAPEPANYDAKLAELLDGKSSSEKSEPLSVQDELPTLDSKDNGRHPFGFPRLQV